MSGTQPTLPEGVDQVPLIRLFPDAAGLTDAAAKAVAQGVATAEAGALLESSQYEPVLGAGSAAEAVPAPPANVDVPYVAQAGNQLTCTMGNWTNAPTSYAYQWKLDGTSAGGNTSAITVTTADAGKTATCVVTASNAVGSTVAPPSNGVVVA